MISKQAVLFWLGLCLKCVVKSKLRVTSRQNVSMTFEKFLINHNADVTSIFLSLFIQLQKKLAIVRVLIWLNIKNHSSLFLLSFLTYDISDVDFMEFAQQTYGASGTKVSYNCRSLMKAPRVLFGEDHASLSSDILNTSSKTEDWYPWNTTAKDSL